MKNKLFGFWNFKLKGVVGSLLLIISRLYEYIIEFIRSYFIKNNLASCGTNVDIGIGFRYRNPSKITIGSNVKIGRDVVFTSELKEGFINIEDNVTIARNCKIDFSGGITLKKGTLLSENVVIQTHDHGLDPRNEPEGKKLLIQENVWVGLNTTILYNTNLIGENSVIAAGSLVTKQVDPNSIYAGIPAKFKKEK